MSVAVVARVGVGPERGLARLLVRFDPEGLESEPRGLDLEDERERTGGAVEARSCRRRLRRPRLNSLWHCQLARPGWSAAAAAWPAPAAGWAAPWAARFGLSTSSRRSRSGAGHSR